MHGALMVILDGLGLGTLRGRAPADRRALQRLFPHCPAAGIDEVRARIVVPACPALLCIRPTLKEGVASPEHNLGLRLQHGEVVADLPLEGD
jgi:hypothetical protein